MERREKGQHHQSRQLKRNLTMTAFDRLLAEQVDIHQPEDPNLEQMLDELRTGPVTDMKQPVNRDNIDAGKISSPVPVQTFDRLRQVLNSDANILILDLEFYLTSDGQQLISEVAGRVYGTNDYFYYTIFDCDRMTPADQIAFLKKTNLTYDVARQYNLNRIMKRVRRFIDQRNISYIASFDNAADFRTLNKEAKRWKWAKQNCFWRYLQPIDLEKIIRDEVFSGQQSISLKKLIRLLNLRIAGERFHQAAHDVQYINMALQFYAQYQMEEVIQPF